MSGNDIPAYAYAYAYANAVELTADDLRDIDSAAAQITVQSNRYPDNLEQMTGH